MRFHLLGLPNSQATAAYSLDGFAMMTIRCARMLKALGHTVFLYASEENEAPCDELITCITKEVQKYVLHNGEYQYAAIDERNALWSIANPRMIDGISERKQPGDFILTIGGASQRPVTDAHPDLFDVEYSIGYVGSYARYRVFESHVWRHATHGFQNNADGRFFDAVIPSFFDPSEFEFRDNPEPYFAYCGRLTEKKGIGIACDAARLAGVPLKVVGHGNPALITYGEYLGALPMLERNRVLANATAVFCPTYYVEPFCCVAVEAQLGGTPVISTDFGGFVETVEHGKTGFHCNYLGEFVEAVERVRALDRAYISERAHRLYSMHNVKHQYQRYFERLQLLLGDGWNSLEPIYRAP